MNYAQEKFAYFFSMGLILLFAGTHGVAQSAEEKKEEHAHPAGGDQEESFVLEHVKDSYGWHIATLGEHHITCPSLMILYQPGRGWVFFSSSRFWDEHHRPVAYQGFFCRHGQLIAQDGSPFYDLSITKNVLAILLSILLMLLLFIGLAFYARRHPSTPKGPAVLLLGLIGFVRDEIARGQIGERHYRRFTPFLLTLFFFILFNNLMGLLPGGANVTGNLSVTFVLAACTFFMTQWHANKSYWKHLFCPPDVPLPVLFILVPIELMGLFTKPLTLIIRLLINMLVGHLILLSVIGIIFELNTIFAALISVPLGAFIFLLKIFVAFLQAYVFTLLSAISIGGAVAQEEH